MNRRTLLGLLAVTTLLGLAACGDDDAATPATQPPATQPPGGATLPPPSDTNERYEHPTGADDIVIRIAYEGGFTTPEMTFANLPVVLVTGDGRLLQQGPVILIYPGPLLPNVQERPISAEGIQQLLALADEHGLLAEREYERNDMIADAADTVVTVAVGDDVFTHRAYALGMGDGPDGAETDEARAALAAFVSAAEAMATRPADDVLGPETAFEPEAYLVRALIAGDRAGSDDEIEPTVVEWPADVSVRLTDEIDCAAVPADEVQALFEQADQLTWFAEEGVTYQVFVKPALPGDSC